jgi:hypothetical protein
MNIILYNQEQYSNIICNYAKALYAATPTKLRSSITDTIKKACSLSPEQLEEVPTEQWTNDPQLPRIIWNIEQVLEIIKDPWFVWDMENNGNIRDIFLLDIFGDNLPPDAFVCNPINNNEGYTTDQQTFIKAIGSLNHFFFARTYYIDRCYGTQAYLNFYYNGSEEEFINAHLLDASSYVDDSGMILGERLLEAWRDNNFRAYINILSFIKPLAGLSAQDFWNWDNSNIIWWVNSFDPQLVWNDNNTISDSWYGIAGNSVSINESKLISTLGNPDFPGYRVSLNDLYLNLNNIESANLASLFGTNLLKGPLNILEIPNNYNESCNIDYRHFEDIPEDPPAGIIPYFVDVITDVIATESKIYVEYDQVDVLDDIALVTTSTLTTLTDCESTGELIDSVIEDEILYSEGGTSPCHNEIDVVTDVFIENLNLRITKTKIKVISITSANNDTNIMSISSCDDITFNNSPVSVNISECDISYYNILEDMNPVSISCVTDVFIENNYLKQRKCTIIVPNKLNDDVRSVDLFLLNISCEES